MDSVRKFISKDGIENLKKRNKTFAKVADTVQHSSLFRKKSKKKEEWIEMFDETSQLPYYVNSVTNESVWEKPKNLESETKRSSSLLLARCLIRVAARHCLARIRRLISALYSRPLYLCNLCIVRER